MRWREEFSWWACAGFDGEGCRTKVTILEVDQILAGRPIEVGRSASLGLPLGWVSRPSEDAGLLSRDIEIFGPDSGLEASR
jgi:hypothetical protein